MTPFVDLFKFEKMVAPIAERLGMGHDFSPSHKKRLEKKLLSIDDRNPTVIESLLQNDDKIHFQLTPRQKKVNLLNKGKISIR